MVIIGECDDDDMDDRRLTYFSAVAEHLSFSVAAKQTHSVQSTVSAGVQSLESELGVKLFERSPQRVALTDAGSQLLPLVRRVLSGMEEVRAVAQSAPLVRGRLRLGVFTNLRAVDIPGVLGEFRRRHPEVELEIRPSSSGSTGLLDDVRRGRLDVAFLGLPAASDEVRGHRVAVSSFVAVLPTAHRLARRKHIDLADLADERFIDAAAGFGNRVVLDAVVTAAGLARLVAVEVADLGEIPRFVAEGLGVALLPALTVVPAAGAVVRDLRPHIAWNLDVITGAEPSAAASAFLALLLERTLPLRTS
jgi:DNA-binding transcriptional LysR family regulator